MLKNSRLQIVAAVANLKSILFIVGPAIAVRSNRRPKTRWFAQPDALTAGSAHRSCNPFADVVGGLKPNLHP